MLPLQCSCLRRLYLKLAIYHPVITVTYSRYNHIMICELAHKIIFVVIFDFIILILPFSKQ
jgi:hypothetical protein